MHTNSEQLCVTGLLCEKLRIIIIKMHSLCITLKVSSVAPPLVADSANESHLKQSNLFPESRQLCCSESEDELASVKFSEARVLPDSSS